MGDIFVSYSSDDRDRARTMANALQRQGWTIPVELAFLAFHTIQGPDLPSELREDFDSYERLGEA